MSNDGQDPKENLRQSLSNRSAEELADICAELILSYVVQKNTPSITQLGMLPVPSNLREMSFVQLMGWLKHNLSLPEFELIEVDDNGVSVKLGEQLFPLGVGQFTGTPDAPAATAVSQPQPTPSASSSPAPPSEPAPSARPSTPAPTPKAPANPQSSTDELDETLSERFSMLEID